jgi:hypothetical protein
MAETVGFEQRAVKGGMGREFYDTYKNAYTFMALEIG